MNPIHPSDTYSVHLNTQSSHGMGVKVKRQATCLKDWLLVCNSCDADIMDVFNTIFLIYLSKIRNRD